MPKFTDDSTGVEVDTDAGAGLVITIPGVRKPLVLDPATSRSLAEQIGYAQEYRDLYPPQPR